MKANWDEETVVETALRMKAYGLLDLVAGNDALAAGSLKKIKAAVLAEQTVPPAIWELATRYPADEREDFRKALEALAAGRYATTPEYGRLAVKYLIKGVPMDGMGMSEEDMVRWLVAGEQRWRISDTRKSKEQPGAVLHLMHQPCRRLQTLEQVADQRLGGRCGHSPRF